MAATSAEGKLGATAPDFTLPATDARTYRLAELKGERGTVVVFMCNHCPYVKAVIDRLIEDARALAGEGVATVAISSNDALAYPADSFDAMRAWAEAKAFPFKYLYDESQEVARAYGAVCTPDFFGFDADLKLRYRGRLDEAGRNPAGPGTRRELLDAMRQVAAGGEVPEVQHASVGCSIKWRRAA